MTDPTRSTSDATAYAESLNARQIGILMTGKSDSSGRGLTIGPAVTRKALQRRGLLDDAMCWTNLGREVVEIIEPGAAGRKPTTTKAGTMIDDPTALDAEYAAVAAECRAAGIRQSVLDYSAEHITAGNSTMAEEIRYLRQVVLADVASYGGEPTTLPELRYAIGMLDSALTIKTDDTAANAVLADGRERRARYVDQLAALIRIRLDALDGPIMTGTRPAADIDEEREMLIAELARYGTVRYPAGSPEYAAYQAALAPELAKFAKREAPYDVEPEPRPGAARLVGLEASDVPAVAAHLNPLAELPEMFAAIRGEQRGTEGREAIDSLAELVGRMVPGFAEAARLAWLKAEEIDDADDSRCTVCGVELPGIGRHDAAKHEAARRAEDVTTIDAVADGPDHSPGAANTLPDVECDDPAHCPVLDADGKPVVIPECFSGNIADVRLFFAGRVKVECGHYTSKSEARAGFKTCERC